jgi:hypothetical protein
MIRMTCIPRKLNLRRIYYISISCKLIVELGIFVEPVTYVTFISLAHLMVAGYGFNAVFVVLIVNLHDNQYNI